MSAGEVAVELIVSSILAVHGTPIAMIESEVDGEPVEGPAIGVTTIEAGPFGRRVAVILYAGEPEAIAGLMTPDLADEVAAKLARFAAEARSEGRA